MKWKEIKKLGANHYKNKNEVEPIDLYLSGGTLKHFAICSIIKYAWRNRNRDIVKNDIDKIIHYAEMLRFLADGKAKDK